VAVIFDLVTGRGRVMPRAGDRRDVEGGIRSASTVLDRSKTLDEVPALAAAPDQGEFSAGHIDAIARARKQPTDDQRAELHERVDSLADLAQRVVVRNGGRVARTR